MWLDWSKRIDVYLGRNVAMVRRHGGATTLIEHPATWPLQRVLERVALTWQLPSQVDAPANATAKPQSGRTKMQLHIALGRSRCQIGNFVIPQGVQRFAELQSLALASAVQSAGSQAILCAMDPWHPGLLSSIGTRFLDELNSWATSHAASISSLQPLWSIASQCSRARRNNIAALALSEPDGITLLFCPNNVWSGNTQTTIATIDPDNPEVHLPGQTLLMTRQVQQKLRRWKIANGLQDANVLTLMFDPALATKSHGLPKTWDAHWSCS